LVDKIKRLPGVAEVQLNFGVGLIRVTHAGPVSEIINFILTNGYGAKTVGNSDDLTPTADILTRKRLLTVTSGIFLCAGVTAGWLGLGNDISVYFFAAAMVTGGFYVYKSALQSLRHLDLDMNVLMTMSSLGAVFIGQWSEAATVVFLFSIGSMLQAYTIDKTRNSIKKMIELSPQEARLVTPEGIEEVIPVDRVKPGDVVLVKPGEYIPVDGTVAEGLSWVNQAPITGESNPVEKEKGDSVFAGSVNNDGSLQIIVRHNNSDSTLAKMIRLVEEAQVKKAPSEQFVDTFARYYTPAVIICALMVIIIPVAVLNRPFAEWFYKALVLLVIACPCALVISTPVSIVSAVGNAARHGILIKGGAYLEALGKVKSIAFDKTGTLTTGQLAVTGIRPADGFTEEQLLQAAGAVERYSEHPVAKPVMAELARRDIAIPNSDTFFAYPGKGARCLFKGEYIYAGNKRLIEELGIPAHGIPKVEDGFEIGCESLVYISSAARLIGIITVSDNPRGEAPGMLLELKRLGIQDVIMLSGDHKDTVADIAGKLGIRQFRAGLLPEDKVKEVEKLARAGVTVMVGDGVNDAPALAAATVGIAMGAAGSDTALETADVALMNDELGKIPDLIKIGTKTLSIIRQNVALAVVLKLVFLVLTMVGMANLWMAVFADTGASVLVTLNGMRLAGFKYKKTVVSGE